MPSTYFVGGFVVIHGTYVRLSLRVRHSIHEFAALYTRQSKVAAKYTGNSWHMPAASRIASAAEFWLGGMD
jgi:hypothetical protein